MPINTTSTSTPEIDPKEFAERMLAKANDKSAKFLDLKVPSVCPSCLGTGYRSVYHCGRRYSKRCESAKWDAERKRFICDGNPNWQELEISNKKEISNQIWKIVVSLKQKDYFLYWLQKEYKTQTLSTLTIQQLELVLNQVKSHAAFNSVTPNQAEQIENNTENKAA